MKVARPEWLTESVKAGVLLPWSDFKYEANERMETQQGKRAPQTSLYNTFITQSSTPRGSALAEVSDIDDLTKSLTLCSRRLYGRFIFKPPSESNS